MTTTVFIGMCGGVGTTDTALDHARRSRATIVDMDLVHGAVAHRCGVAASRTIADLASLADSDLTADQVAALVYDTPDLRIIASPGSPELAEIVPASLVGHLLELLVMRGTVVVDGGSRIDTCVLAAMRAAGEVVLIARADAFCARQVRATVQLLERAGVSGCPILVRVPQSSRRTELSFAAGVGLAVHQPRHRQGGSALALPRLVFQRRRGAHAGGH